MLTEKLKSYFPILVILFLLGGVYLGYANVWLCVAAFVVALTRLNKEEFVFMMLMTGAEYFGAVARIFMGFTVIPQFFTYIVVLAILAQRIVPLFRQNRMVNYLFFFLLIVFFISYLYGPQHAYSNIKLVRIFLYGLLCFWTFLIYNEECNINPMKLAYIFALAGVTYIVMGVTVYHFGTPSSILDFGYFGRHVQQSDNFTLSYHTVGLAALYGVVFLLSPTDDKHILKAKSVILLLILLFMALISQMRQGILGIVILLFFRYIILMKNNTAYKMAGLLLLAGIGLFLINDVQTDAFKAMSEAKNFEEMVNRPYDKAMEIMEKDPWFGRGLGGYSYNGKVAYPHNIFLEVINEMGFVNLLVIIIVSLYAMKCNGFSWKSVNANGTYAILLLLAIFIRVNASGDLTENIYFFALLFSMGNREYLVENIEEYPCFNDSQI